MTVVLVGGTPASIAELEKSIELYEKMNVVRYERREKFNSCSYGLFFAEGIEPNAEFIQIMTKKLNELFVTIVDETSARLIYEGNEIHYPKEG